MTEKENSNKKEYDNSKSSAEDNKANDGPTTAVHNPFEKGAKELTPEELDNLEQFKEAQTERD